MKLLAIDTSTEQASVALMVDGAMTVEEQGSQRTHAQLILPMIDRLIIESGLSLQQLDGIVFGCGPGSFTGLRIACSIAKGLAYAHDLPLTPVGSLDAIAWATREQHACSDLPVLAVLDARMKEMYWGYFAEGTTSTIGRVNPVREIQVPDGQAVVLAGVGIDEYWDDFTQTVTAHVKERLTVYPNAGAMIRLALHARLPSVEAALAQPVYVRNQVTQGDSRG